MKRRKQWAKFRVLLEDVVKHGLVVGGCGVVNHRWWWLVVKDCFGFVGYGGFVVRVGQLDWVWSLFGWLGPLIILP